MPDSRDIHAPHATFTEVYDLYKETVKDALPGTVPAVSYSVFRSTWADRFPQLKLRRVMQKFSKCTPCQEYTEKLKTSVSRAERAELERCFRMHLKDAMAQRYVYTANCNLGHQGVVVSMAIDGAACPDGLPMFVQKDKECLVGHHLNVHMYGVIEHGRKYGLFTTPYNVPGGECNLVVAAVFDFSQLLSACADSDARQL